MSESIITKLTNCDVLSVWMDTINQIIDEINQQNTVWTTNVSALSDGTICSVYQFTKNFPTDGRFDVFYGAILIDPADYTISGNKLLFNEPPQSYEVGYPIRIYYKGVDNSAYISTGSGIE